MKLSSFEFRNSRVLAGLICLGVLIAAGCDRASEIDSSAVNQSAQIEPQVQLPDVPDSRYRFNAGFMLQADGEPIAVESPGYACPTIADVDGDGVHDLVVGQFNGGKMHYYRNLSKPDETPEYASRQWINTGSEPAQVPGVS